MKITKGDPFSYLIVVANTSANLVLDSTWAASAELRVGSNKGSDTGLASATIANGIVILSLSDTSQLTPGPYTFLIDIGKIDKTITLRKKISTKVVEKYG